MKRIALVTSNIKIISDNGALHGGGGVVTQNLIIELLKLEDIELTIFTEINSRIDIPNANVIEIPYRTYDYKFKQEVDKYIESEKFDIVLASNTYFLFQNYLLQCHSFLHRAKNIFPLFRPVKKFFSRKKIESQNNLFKMCDKSNKFIAVSEIIKKDYSENLNIDKDNIIVIHPACKQIFNEIPQIIKKESPTFGIVANSSINKGGHYFLTALGIAKLFGLKFNLKIIAPKYNKDFLMQSLVNIFGMKKQIDILPFQENMNNFYSEIDFLVMPSINEAFGLVALEAMSYAKIPIVSSTTGICDIVSNDNGFIFKRNSFIDFVKTILKAGKMYKNNFEQYKILATTAFNTSKQHLWKDFALNITNNF